MKVYDKITKSYISSKLIEDFGEKIKIKRVMGLKLKKIVLNSIVPFLLFVSSTLNTGNMVSEFVKVDGNNKKIFENEKVIETLLTEGDENQVLELQLENESLKNKNSQYKQLALYYGLMAFLAGSLGALDLVMGREDREDFKKLNDGYKRKNKDFKKLFYEKISADLLTEDFYEKSNLTEEEFDDLSRDEKVSMLFKYLKSNKNLQNTEEEIIDLGKHFQEFLQNKFGGHDEKFFSFSERKKDECIDEFMKSFVRKIGRDGIHRINSESIFE